MSMVSTPAVTSSSSTLWATPSKEWVIPAKPKPGRKPKKEVIAPICIDDETDSKGRRVQNRAAQRAFRERKQLQLADLQARVQQYEQGEIERTVAIQSLAKRLKEENDKLKAENQALKDKVAQYEHERDGHSDSHRKRWRDPADHEATESSTSKRPKITLAPHSLRDAISYLSSPSSNISATDSADSVYSPFSPISLNSSPIDNVASTVPGSPFGELPAIQKSWKSSIFDTETTSLQGLDCRFCSATEGTCMCAELALHQVTGSSPLKLENMDLSLIGVNRHLEDRSTVTTELSILDNLPPYQPPVPLRRRLSQPPSVGNATASVFPVWMPAAATDTSATCSGDPANCMACADDDFGKAFCAAFKDSVKSATPSCDACPNTGTSGPPARTRSPVVAATDFFATTSAPAIEPPKSSENLPTHEAWRALKSHPNAAFADLRLLAEVVARRSKCTGPTVEIVPAPGSITPERTTSSPVHFGADDSQSILLTDPHAQYREEQARRTAPADVVVKCGCKDIRQVPADGVRDALRLLDGPFGPHA